MLEMPAAEHSITVIVPPVAAGERLDAFLQHYAGEPELSRSEWQRLIGLDAVRLNGQPSKSGQRLTSGDLIQIVHIAREPNLSPQDEVPFDVVFEDPAMVVVNKPAGVVVHPAPGNRRRTLVNGLLARFPELREADGDLRPGIVHRLDKDTSGLLVVGRTLAGTAALQRQMQSRSPEKRYLVLVRGNIGEDEGLIDAPIARDLRTRQRMAVRAGGRDAQTRFWVCERFGEWTLVEALLLTGRTHQLRVHFAYIGHPVAGDETYGRGQSPTGLYRQFLHSHSLRLKSPYDGQEHAFVADLPPDLADALERLRRRSNGTRNAMRRTR